VVLANTRSKDRLADGFYYDWIGQRNADGTCNDGKTDLDALLAYIMFHGRAVLDAEKKSNRFRAIVTVDERHYRVPFSGVLASAGLHGRELLEEDKAEGGDKFVSAGPWELDASSSKQKSQHDRVSKMLAGTLDVNPGWLVQLAVGLGMESEAMDHFWRLFGSTRVLGNVPDSHRIADFIARHDEIQSRQKQKQIEAASSTKRDLSRKADYALFDALSAVVGRLDVPPREYPDTLSVRVLAGMLRASRLEHGWEREYEKVQSLYSDLHGYGMQSAMDLVSGYRDVVVLGDPGHGKSTLLAGLALQAVDEGSPVVYARLDDLGRVAAEDSFQPSKWKLKWAVQMVLEAAMASGLTLEPAIGMKAIEALSTAHDSLVVLDGWDEVSSEEHRLAAERVLQILTGTWAGRSARDEGMAGKLILASRVTGYRRPVPAINEVLVTLMDASTTAGFFETWFASEENGEGLGRVQEALADRRFAEMARIPVLAGFIAVVAKDEEPRTTKHGLYEQYLRRFLVRAWRGGRFMQRSPAEINDRLRIATAAAWIMATSPTKDRHRIDQWEDHLSADCLGKWTGSETFHGPRGWYREVHNLAMEDGLLVPHGRLRDEDPGSQHYRWLHRTIHEHLVGRRLMELVRDKPKEGLVRIRQAVSRSNWREALEHCAGFLSDSSLHQLAVDSLFSYRTDVKPLDDLVRSALVTFVHCSGLDYRRGELIKILIKAEDWAALEELDRGHFLDHVRDIDVEELTDWGTTNLGWKVADRGDVELMEKLVSRMRASTNRPDGLESHYYSALHKKEPTKAQLLSIKAYREQRIEGLPVPLMADAKTSVVQELCVAIKNATSSYDISIYLDAVARAGHGKSKEMLEAGMDGILHRDVYLELFEALEPVGAFKNAALALETKRFRPALLQRILSASSPDYLAFSFAFSLPALAEQQDSLSSWARAGYWAGVFANLLDRPLEGFWSAARASAAIDQMLEAWDVPEGQVVAEFYQAVIWAAANFYVDRLSDISIIGARGHYHRERWNWWIWDQFAHALSDRLEGHDWAVVFNYWKTASVELDGMVDLDKILGRQEASSVDACFREVLEWYVYEAPTTSHFPHYLPPAVLDNVHDKALTMLNSVPECKSPAKAKSLLSALVMWMQTVDTLPRNWKSVKAAGRAVAKRDAMILP
jgi:hypothetical protein